MSRNISSDMQAGLEARAVRPVLITRLDIVGDPIYAWTGPGLFAPVGTGDPALDGIAFSPSDALVGISAISEDQSMGGPITLTATAHSEDEPLLRQVVRDRRKWLGQAAYLWMGLLDDDDATVIASPVRIKTGVMTNMTVTRSETAATIDVIVDADLGNSKSAAFRWIDHPSIYAADTFSTFVIRLANKPRGFDKDSTRITALPPGFTLPNIGYINLP